MLGGAIALALLILPVIIITTREAVRAGAPRDPRRLAGARAPPCGRRPGGRRCRRPSRASRPARSSGCPAPSARRPRCCCSASPVGIRFDPNGLLSQFTALPMQIYNMTSQLAGGVPDGRGRGDHRPARHDPRHERGGHLHPQQVPKDLVRENMSTTHRLQSQDWLDSYVIYARSQRDDRERRPAANWAPGRSRAGRPGPSAGPGDGGARPQRLLRRLPRRARA